MAQKMLKTTGVFDGLKLPQNARGKYVLISRGKVVGTSKSAKDLIRKSASVDGKTILLAVPKDDLAIAAY